jgi:hypothetical protein
MAPVLKTGRAQALVGSNPTPSATILPRNCANTRDARYYLAWLRSGLVENGLTRLERKSFVTICHPPHPEAVKMLFLWRANHARDESELRLQSFAAGVAYDSSTWPYPQKGARFKRSSQSGAEAQFWIIPPPPPLNFRSVRLRCVALRTSFRILNWALA